MVSGYREVRTLGEGRAGRVVLAVHTATGTPAAIRYLHPRLGADHGFLTRFRYDIARLAKLECPQIVRVHEYADTGDGVALITELVDGVSLRAILAEHERTGPEAALAAVKSLLLAMAAAHDAGVAHRACGPGSVFVLPDGQVKVADFGLAPPGAAPPYRLPEGAEPGGTAADLHAAACILAECVTGEAPSGTRVPEGLPRSMRELVADALALARPREAGRHASRGVGAGGRGDEARAFAQAVEEAAWGTYGPEWERRGRRHLGELAAALAARLPPAEPAPVRAGAAHRRPSWFSPGRRLSAALGRARHAPARPAYAAATVLASLAVIAVVVAARTGDGRPDAFPATPARTPGGPEAAPTAPEARRSGTPTRDAPSLRAAPRKPDDTGGASDEAEDSAAPARPAAARTTTAPAAPRTSGVTVAAPTRAAATAPGVSEVRVLSWDGSAGMIRVTAEGAGPVRLTVAYTRREGDGPARTLETDTRTLRGRSVYTVEVSHAAEPPECGRRVHLGIVVTTDRTAANGPQVEEAALDGPACEPSAGPTGDAPPEPDDPHSPTPSVSAEKAR